MSKRFGFELLAQQCADQTLANVSSWAVGWQSMGVGQTPIEQLLIYSVYCHLKFVEQEWFENIKFAREDNLEERKNSPDYRRLLIVQEQVQFPDWRVDFLVHAYADWGREPNGGVEGWRRLIVECDGHDFHERTKEQAAKDRGRDRWAQTNGIEVFRFTGSELWRDPLKCAGQVIEWANRGV